MTHDSGLRTHHIGILVKDISAAAEGYISILRYHPRTEVIRDPIQNALVQFLALAGDEVYLELIAPDGPQSHLNSALKKGGGVHHVCYTVSGIDAMVAQMQEKGYLLIRSPQPAVAFNGRAIAWLMNRDHLLVELVEKGAESEL